MTTTDKTVDPAQRAWRRKEWCAAVGCCPSLYYVLRKHDPDLIEEVKLRNLTLVLTPPLQYLRAQAARRAAEREQAAKAAAAVTAPEDAIPAKRPRGRPRKHAPRPTLPDEESEQTAAPADGRDHATS